VFVETETPEHRQNSTPILGEVKRDLITRDRTMRAMCALSVYVLVLAAAVGCATHSMYGPYYGDCGSYCMPNGYSNTCCGGNVCNDKLVPCADKDMVAGNCEQIPNFRHRPFMRHCMSDGMGYYDGEMYTTRAPRDFFLSSPSPLGE